ncbi:MAG: penicillin-binding protein [Actinomycetota bacterium]|nr:penicillin-binding protein [Actinomycetota bacterium]
MRRLSWRSLTLVGVGGGLAGGLLLGGVGYALTDVPEAAESVRQQSTLVTYADGSELARLGEQNRRLVGLDAVSDVAERAVLAAEDRGFYSSPGISPTGIARALFANVQGGGVEQGGSTITQQYAKNAYLTSERTFSRKVKEVFIALKMTQTRSKDEILEDYLNTIYFGRGAWGIEAATETYFGGRAADLSVGQAAVLASSIRSPAGYDPARHPDRARARWEYVLDGMVDKGWLTAEERAQQRYPNVRAPESTKRQDRAGPQGYVLDRVEDEMAALGYEQRMSSGGLVIQTTLRKQAQEAAVAAVQEEIPAGAGGSGQAAIQGALVAVRPGTGEVYAYYGGRTGNGGFDYARSRQDPGSTMKPYVLAAALEQGIGLRTRVNGNSPREFAGYPVPVRNFDDQDFGRITLTTATENSVNTAYVALAAEVGPQAVADVARRAGIGEQVQLSDAPGEAPALGIALGIYGVPVVDQAAGFATFAAGGVAAEPFLVKSVREQRSREVVYTAEARTSQAFPAEVAADATYAMRQVVESGTARRNGRLDDGRPAAGKTGTTQESNDAWMVGYTPQLSTAVWIGRGDNEPIVGELGSSGGLTGGSAPARIWKAFMDGALEGQPVEEFPDRAFVGSARSLDGADDGVVGDQPRRRRERVRERERVTEEPTAEPTAEASEPAAPEPTEEPAPEPSGPADQPPAEEPDEPAATPEQEAEAAPSAAPTG